MLVCWLLHVPPVVKLRTQAAGGVPPLDDSLGAVDPVAGAAQHQAEVLFILEEEVK